MRNKMCVCVCMDIYIYIYIYRSFPVVKNPSANAEDPGLIPGWGRSPGGGHGNHGSILAWRIPRTEDPGGLQSMRGGWVQVDGDLESGSPFQEGVGLSPVRTGHFAFEQPAAR